MGEKAKKNFVEASNGLSISISKWRQRHENVLCHLPFLLRHYTGELINLSAHFHSRTDKLVSTYANWAL